MTFPTMRIVNELGDWLQIEFRKPAHPNDPTDAGWISTPIEGELAGLFTVHIWAVLLRAEIVDFYRQLQSIWSAGSGAAVLTAVDRWVDLRVSLSDTGEVAVSGELGAPLTPRVRLAFEIPEVGREQLETMLTDLAKVHQHVSTFTFESEVSLSELRST